MCALTKCSTCMMGTVQIKLPRLSVLYSVRFSYNCSCNLVYGTGRPSFYQVYRYHQYHVMLKQQVIAILILDWSVCSFTSRLFTCENDLNNYEIIKLYSSGLFLIAQHVHHSKLGQSVILPWQLWEIMWTMKKKHWFNP